MRTAEEIDTGGIVTVYLGEGYGIPFPYANHPQVNAVHTKKLIHGNYGDILPGKTRWVVMTDRIPHAVHKVIQQELKRRHTPWVFRNTDAAIEAKLREYIPHPYAQSPVKKPIPAPETNGNGHPQAHTVPPPVAAAPQPGPDKSKVLPRGRAFAKDGTMLRKGAILDFVKGNVRPYTKLKDEAERLFALAQEAGIKTTAGSLMQSLYITRIRQEKSETEQKRKDAARQRAAYWRAQKKAEATVAQTKGQRDTAPKAAPGTDLDTTIGALDRAITALQFVKLSLEQGFQKDYETVAALQKENGELRARLDLITEAFRGIS